METSATQIAGAGGRSAHPLRLRVTTIGAYEMSLILVIIVILLIFGGGGYYGFRSGYYGAGGFGGILGLLVLLLILYLIFGGGYRTM
jgi:hypothetical protein